MGGPVSNPDFDMDHDGIDDIVIMDDVGGLSILYGNQTGIFTVQFLENVYDFALGSHPETGYFTGALRYDGPGFVEPDSLPKSADLETVSKQDIIRQTLFTQVQIPKATTDISTPPPPASTTLGTTLYNTLDTDPNGFLRMDDSDAAGTGATTKADYQDLGETGGDNISVTGNDQDSDSFNLLNAEFLNQKNVLVTKKYTSTQTSDALTSGSPVEVTLEIKNTSNTPLTHIVLLEKYPNFLDVPDTSYDIQNDGKQDV